jgi:hypothetical protein
LQDSVYLAERDISSLRTRDSARATSLQTELDDLSDEVIYLRVKLRKERTLAQSEYNDVQTRIENVRSRARADASLSSAPAPRVPDPPAPAPPAAPRAPDVRVPRRRGPRFPPTPSWTSGCRTSSTRGPRRWRTGSKATTGGRSHHRRPHSGARRLGDARRRLVRAAGRRLKRKAEMTVTFDQLTINGRSYPIRGTVTQAIEGEGVKGDLPKAGVGAGVGAIIGGILGGFKGAMAGILIGGGGTIAATEGKEVELPQGTVLRVRIESPVPL